MVDGLLGFEPSVPKLGTFSFPNTGVRLTATARCSNHISVVVIYASAVQRIAPNVVLSTDICRAEKPAPTRHHSVRSCASARRSASGCPRRAVWWAAKLWSCFSSCQVLGQLTARHQFDRPRPFCPGAELRRSYCSSTSCVGSDPPSSHERSNALSIEPQNTGEPRMCGAAFVARTGRSVTPSLTGVTSLHAVHAIG